MYLISTSEEEEEEKEDKEDESDAREGLRYRMARILLLREK